MDVSNRGRGAALLALSAILVGVSSVSAAECPGECRLQAKISESQGGFGGSLDTLDGFGAAVCRLGDLDGDGVEDLAIGATGDDDGGAPPNADRGAVWIAFLNRDGTVKEQQKISQTQGGFSGNLDDSDGFGRGLAWLGDLGPGAATVSALAVGSPHHDEGGTDKGAVWILFLNPDGTVNAYQKISDTQGGFGGPLDPGDGFGHSLASLDDLDQDGVNDLVVGAPYDDEGDEDQGAAWILFLNADGTVKAHQTIAEARGGFSGTLDTSDGFGVSLAALGDLDGDGVTELAIGAAGDDDGRVSPTADRGAVWILFLNPDGTVEGHQKISELHGGFSGALENGDLFGAAVAAPGDLDRDGRPDLVVSAPMDDDGGQDRGALWVLFVDSDGTLRGQRKIGSLGSFAGPLDNADQFGFSVCSVGDLDDDGIEDLAVGAPFDDEPFDGGDGTANQGAVWLAFLDAPLWLYFHADWMSWGPAGGAIRYDLIRGDLRGLRDSAGDFSQATEECLATDHCTPSSDCAPSPSPGEGFWYLVRRQWGLDNGTYDTCNPVQSQVEGRDAEVAASGVDCP